MPAIFYWLYLLICVVSLSTCTDTSDIEINKFKYKWPAVAISVLVRNKAHTLPYFLSSLTQLDYPKDRLSLWIYSDFNQDNSIEIIDKWVNKHGSEYNHLNFTKDTTKGPLHHDEKNANDWSPSRFKHVIKLRNEALNVARKNWADFLFMLDADVFLTKTDILKILISKDFNIVAPMLLSDGLYSNFWCGMTDTYYYKRTDDYKPILTRDADHRGCFSVPMIHSAVLINLNILDSDRLTYDPDAIEGYDGPEDDIIAFAVNAVGIGLDLHICNDHLYGYVPVPLVDTDDLEDDLDTILNLKLEAISRNGTIPLHPLLEPYIQYPEKWKFNCDEIYMINLERRQERRVKMMKSFQELGMDVKHFKAVDGRDLDVNDLSKFSITLMPNYEDPFHKRPMKTGEVGCFLSHYYIWKEIVEKDHRTSLVLEDDIRFVPYFRQKLLQILDELRDMEWDLVYIGRKVLIDSDEVRVTQHMVKPLYSYWTLGYLISSSGARKLLDAEPLTKMLPVDEYLPIMFDTHPNDEWNQHFPVRNLIAYSAAPLLVHPTHFIGDEGYISDTEQSHLVEETSEYANMKHEL